LGLAILGSISACGGGDSGPPGGSFAGSGGSGNASTGATGGTTSGGAGGTSGSSTGGTTSGGTGGAGGSGGTISGVGCKGYANISADAACTKWASSVCGVFTQCWTEYLILEAWDSLATCQDRIKVECLQTLAAPGVQLKPAIYAAGADIWSQTTCSKLYAFQNPVGGWLASDPDCGGPGSLADGATCYVDEQCSGLDCDIPTGAHCGKCKSPGKQGAICFVDFDCEPDLYCVSKMCQVRSKLGEACTANAQCVSGAFCDNGKCANRLAAGGACDETSDCQPEFVCSSSGTCKTPSLGTSGASCDFMETYSCDAFKGYDCDLNTKTCMLNTWPGVGQPCGATGNFWCSGGATCVIQIGQPSGTCMKVAADGATCSDFVGPDCTKPAECINGKCAVVDASVCP